MLGLGVHPEVGCALDDPVVLLLRDLAQHLLTVRARARARARVRVRVRVRATVWASNPPAPARPGAAAPRIGVAMVWKLSGYGRGA